MVWRLKVDTREQEMREVVPRIAKVEGVQCIEEALPIGDYESPHAICERKTAEDLVRSINNGRVYKQLGKALTTKKEFMLLITGSYDAADKIITGFVASSLVRYPNFRILWITDEYVAIWTMIKWFKKVESIGVSSPHFLPPEVIVSKLFDIPIKPAKTIVKKYIGMRSLISVILSDPKELEKISGLGKVRVSRMKSSIDKWKNRY